MRKKWIDAVVNHNKELVVTEYSVVCAKHWPFGFKKYTKNGRERPAEPPSLFGDIPVPNKLSFEVRNSVQDEMETFEDADKVQYQDL